MIFISYKTIAALLIFLVSIATVIYPLNKLRTHREVDHTESFELGEALASGIFLGIAFFHMLPNSVTTFQQLFTNINYPIPEIICMIGFSLLLFLERLSLDRSMFKSQHIIPYTLALILIIHSLTEGAALGISSTGTEALIVFIAIIAHKSSDSFVLCMILMRYHFPFWRIITIITIFSLMTPMGIGFGTLASLFTQSFNGQLTEAIFDAFAAGTFLYISTLHHLRFHQRIEEAQSLLEFTCMMIGLVAMGAIALLI
ncbi:MAG TPA: ZIP family metal transporter [Gammaproteobacteria bacterium]|nr:ZIP family metal transporter [Gammaproteobacteria bacterium]